MTKRQGGSSLSWKLYLGVGAIVAIVSKIVKWTNPENTSMTLFFWVGVIMGLVGLGKMALGKSSKKEGKKIQQEQQRYEQQLHQQEQQWQKQQEQPAQHNIVECPNCGTRHYSSSNFCHKCGSRLK